MIRVRTPSRLHFGLLSLAGEEPGLNALGQRALPARLYGGAGLMVEEPGIELTVTPADCWSARGPLAERALGYAGRFAQTLPVGAVRPCHLDMVRASPEHTGLGTGTQLGLAVARGLTAAYT